MKARVNGKLVKCEPIICDLCGCRGHMATMNMLDVCIIALQHKIKELEAENASLRKTILKHSITIEQRRKNRQ